MASSSSTARISFRIVIAIALIVLLFYVARPLYWKISATIHDIRHNKQSVGGGLSQIVYEAQKSLGWYHDESDSGILEHRPKQSNSAAARRLLLAAF